MYKNLAPYLVYSSAIYAAVYLAFGFLTISYKVSDEINRFVFIPKWVPRVWWACFWLTLTFGPTLLLAYSTECEQMT